MSWLQAAALSGSALTWEGKWRKLTKKVSRGLQAIPAGMEWQHHDTFAQPSHMHRLRSRLELVRVSPTSGRCTFP